MFIELQGTAKNEHRPKISERGFPIQQETQSKMDPKSLNRASYSYPTRNTGMKGQLNRRRLWDHVHLLVSNLPRTSIREHYTTYLVVCLIVHAFFTEVCIRIKAIIRRRQSLYVGRGRRSLKATRHLGQGWCRRAYVESRQSQEKCTRKFGRGPA